MFVPIAPLGLMFLHGRNLPKARGDCKDSNPVNRHLRLMDDRLKASYGPRGIFATEVYSGIAHALLPSGPLLFLHFSGVAQHWCPDLVRSLEVLLGMFIAACVPYYGRVAWRRYKKAFSAGNA